MAILETPDDAAHESGCIKGAGRIEVLPKGTILVFR